MSRAQVGVGKVAGKKLLMSENCKIGATGVPSVDVCTFLFSFRGNSSFSCLKIVKLEQLEFRVSMYVPSCFRFEEIAP